MPFVPISAAGAGANTLVAAVSGKRIRVIGLSLVCGAANTVTFKSAAGGTALTGAMSFPANGGIVLPYQKAGWFETSPGELLDMNLSGATAVGGSLIYMEV